MLFDGSELKRKNFELRAQQLESDSFALRNGFDLVKDQKERGRRQEERIRELVERGTAVTVCWAGLRGFILPIIVPAPVFSVLNPVTARPCLTAP
ncbi:MAG: hypothetical protein ACE5GM_03750 [bacterium]